MVFGIFSCASEREKSRAFDENAFCEAREKRESNVIENYEFEYSISNVIPNAAAGKVTVRDGKGNAEITFDDLRPGDEDYASEIEYYAKK